jgi:hypothetical protein
MPKVKVGQIVWVKHVGGHTVRNGGKAFPEALSGAGNPILAKTANAIGGHVNPCRCRP